MFGAKMRIKKSSVCYTRNKANFDCLNDGSTPINSTITSAIAIPCYSSR